MPDRRARRAAIAIVGGFVVMDLSMIATGRSGLHWLGDLDVPNFFLLALVFAQASLAGVWVGISTYPLAQRIAFALVWIGLAAGILLAVVITTDDLDSYVYLCLFLCAHAGVVAILLLVARMRRAALERDGILVSKGHLQFSIANVLVLTAASALVLALNARFGWFERHVRLSDSIAVAALAFPVVGAVWAILGTGRFGFRLVGLLGAVLIGMLLFVGGIGGQYAMALWTFTFLTVLVAIPLFIFRRLGYRFTRRRSSDVQENAQAA